MNSRSNSENCISKDTEGRKNDEREARKFCYVWISNGLATTSTLVVRRNNLIDRSIDKLINSLINWLKNFICHFSIHRFFRLTQGSIQNNNNNYHSVLHNTVTLFLVYDNLYTKWGGIDLYGTSFIDWWLRAGQDQLHIDCGVRSVGLTLTASDDTAAYWWGFRSRISY